MAFIAVCIPNWTAVLSDGKLICIQLESQVSLPCQQIQQLLSQEQVIHREGTVREMCNN